MTRKVKIGIMPMEQFKQRTMAIAKGQYQIKKNEPKIWFQSVKSLANLLSEDNQKLLRLIIDTHPNSVSELEKITGRKANNLLRTLRSLEQSGFVKLEQSKIGGRGRAPLIPKVLYDMVDIEISF